MDLQSYFAQDKQGNVQPGAWVYLYLPGTTTLVTGHQDADGNALPNPFQADEDGRIQLAAPNGIYDLRVATGGLDTTMRVSFLDPAQALSDIDSKTTRAAAAAVTAEIARDAAQLSAGVYKNTAAGLAATTENQYFSVPSADDAEFLVLYLHDAGSIATDVKRYPSTLAVSNAVARIDTDVLNARSVNLFNPDDVVPGYYFSPGSNAIIASVSYRMSGWIPVVAGRAYSLTGVLGQYMAFYDTKQSANALSSSSKPTVIAPTGANWAVFNITNEGQDVSTYDTTAQFEQSASPTHYVPYKKMVGSHLLPTPLPTLTGAGKNLFDKSAVVNAQYYSPSVGGIRASTAYRRTGFIPVIPGNNYVGSGFGDSYAMGFFANPDATEQAVGEVLSTTNGTPFTVPVGANYVVINLTNAGWDDLTYDNTAQVEIGLSVTEYEPYQPRLSGDQIDLELVRANDVFEHIELNLFDPSRIDWTKRLSPSTGNVVGVDANPLIATGPIPVAAGEWYSFGGTAATDTVGMFGMASQPVATQKAALTAIDGGFKFKIPADIKWMRLNLKATPETQTLNGQLQLNKGELLDDYVEYERETKIKPTYLPDMFVYSSFNVIDPASVGYERRYSTGSKAMITDSLAIVASDYIPVIEGEWYTLSGVDGVYGLSSSASACQGGYFAQAGDTNAIDNIAFATPVIGGGAAFLVPTGLGVTHVVVSLRPKDDVKGATTLNGDVQLETGEMATEYRPYKVEQKIKNQLLPEIQQTSSTGGSLDAEQWYKFTEGDEGGTLADKIPVFRSHWLKRDKDLCVVNTGTSLTARSTEHSTNHPDAATRPPLMHSRNMASIVWDKLHWPGQQYRRYDSTGFFSESVGIFATSSNLPEWDDGLYRAGLTRYSGDTGAQTQFVVPVGARQFNFIYRTDTTGTDSVQVSISEGIGQMEVFDEIAGNWVEANGYLFSMRESAPVLRDILVPRASTGELVTRNIHSKGDTTYQKRLKMRCKSGVIDSRSITKLVTISGQSAGRFMYWGVEWSPREYMITYINAARGSHNTQADTARGLPKWQDNEIWGFKPDLMLFELPIHNDGTDSATAYTGGYWARLTDHFVFRADYELSLKTRGASFGLTPEIAMFTSSIAWNFGGIADDGSLKFNDQLDGASMTSLDKFNQAYEWVTTTHPDVVMINSVQRWVDAAIAIFGDLRTATEGSGKAGNTFTNEGSHWNDTGSKIIAKTITPLLRFL